MNHIYTGTQPLPRMPRIQKKRGIAARMSYAERLKAKAEAEKAARQKAERELRVLRRVVFRLEDQSASTCASLKLINHVSPK